MKFLLTGIGILIVAIFIKWLWEQSKSHDKKSFKIILGICISLFAAVSIISWMKIEQYRVSSTIQGVVTRLNVYKLRGTITHYDATVRGLSASGAFVSNQDNITINANEKNAQLIEKIQTAHKQRNVVFITFDTVTTYLIGDDFFELKSVEVIPKED